MNCTRDRRGKLVTDRKVTMSSRVENKLNVYYTNCRSILNKIDLLRGLACVEKFDIIALTETWLDMSGKVFNPEVKIDGYTLFYKDRENRRGGGVALYIRDTLQCCINGKIKTDSKTESLWVDIKEGSQTVVLGLVYRPPNASQEINSSLWQELNRASKYRQICVLGDFNYRNVDWDLMIGNRESEEFLKVMQDNFLKQLVIEPTRGNNILDLIITNSDDIIEQVDVGGYLGNSDHREIRCKIKFERAVRDKNVSKIPDFRRGNFEGLRSYLQEIDWHQMVREISTQVENVRSREGEGRGISGEERRETEVWQGSAAVQNEVRSGRSEDGIERLYNYLVSKIHAGQLANIPCRAIRSDNNDPKWMTARLKHYIGLKRGIYKKIKAGDEGLRPQYNELARTVRKLTKNAKNTYELKVARQAKTDPKGFYQLYRTKNRETIGPLKAGDGELVSSGEEKSKIMNDYFLTVFTQETLQDMPESEQVFNGEENELLTDITITKEIVEQEIDKLKKFKSPGPDEIYPIVLKECKEVISETLMSAFRKSLDTGEVPLMWRRANVVPIFKKGDKTLASNYRPVSLTSIVGKIMESIIAKNIREHLERHKLIRESQHGFMKGKSCLTNLLSFYSKVYESADNGDSYDILYLDFSKAFDKVPHQRLLRKVRAHGIDGKILGWIRSWLADRQQRVVLNGFKSEWGQVISGVPQGSVLGPLLFLIYINDLDSGISSDVSKFADDTKIGRVIKSDTDVIALQTDLDKMNEWSNIWQMKFNINKCKVLNVGRGNPHNKYTLNQEELESSEYEKDLGVIINSDLRLRKQCLEARNKANRVLGFIFRSVKSRSPEVILKLYLALVRPHLDYAVQFWSPHYRKDINLIESVQRRMTKRIQGMRDIPYDRRLKMLNLHSLERRRLRGDLIEVFKWYRGYNKGDVNRILRISNQDRTRNNGFKLEKSRYKKEIGKNWFSNRVVDKWNALSGQVVSARTIESFKTRLDRHMDENDR